mmetsp:Transcript_54707/g.127624  ORF Transcript_54707/g.127624 Transcript_54707/m.127624 type:complete len:304 (-) Transcript_54707:1777-2688(-)
MKALFVSITLLVVNPDLAKLEVHLWSEVEMFNLSLKHLRIEGGNGRGLRESFVVLIGGRSIFPLVFELPLRNPLGLAPLVQGCETEDKAHSTFHEGLPLQLHVSLAELLPMKVLAVKTVRGFHDDHLLPQVFSVEVLEDLRGPGILKDGRFRDFLVLINLRHGATGPCAGALRFGAPRLQGFLLLGLPTSADAGGDGRECALDRGHRDPTVVKVAAADARHLLKVLKLLALATAHRVELQPRANAILGAQLVEGLHEICVVCGLPIREENHLGRLSLVLLADGPLHALEALRVQRLLLRLWSA